MNAPREAPELILPAPWGAAVALGLVKVVPMPSPTRWRGLVRVVQAPGGQPSDFRRRMNCLLKAADKKRWRMGREIPSTLCSQPGLVGWVELAHCADLRLPGCPYTWDDHYNAGEQRPEPWAWLLINARPATSKGARPPQALPTQQVLFAGV